MLLGCTNRRSYYHWIDFILNVIKLICSWKQARSKCILVISIQNHGYPEMQFPSIRVASLSRPTLYKSLSTTVLNRLRPNSKACALHLCATPSAEVTGTQDTRRSNAHTLDFMFHSIPLSVPTSGPLPAPAVPLASWSLRNARGSQDTGVVGTQQTHALSFASPLCCVGIIFLCAMKHWVAILTPLIPLSF